MPNIGPLEIIIVLVIVLVIFGPKRLPELGRSMGRGMREFKSSVTGKDEDTDAKLEAGAPIPAPPTVSQADAPESAEQPAAPGDRSS